MRSQSVAGQNEFQVKLAIKCKAKLIQSVEACVNLNTLSIVVTRSWAVIHNGLTSALLLGLIGETKSDVRVRQLVAEILEIFTSEIEEGEDRLSNIDNGAGTSKGHARALSVLRYLLSEQNISGRTRPETEKAGSNNENELREHAADT